MKPAFSDSTHIKVRPFCVLFIIFIQAILIYLTANGVMSIIDEYNLVHYGEKVTAKVTNVGVHRGVKRIKYSFRLEDGREFSGSDSTGRENLWVRYPENVIISAKIKVLYYPNNPWVNTPITNHNSNSITRDIYDDVAAIIVFGTASLIIFYLLIIDYRKIHKNKEVKSFLWYISKDK